MDAPFEDVGNLLEDHIVDLKVLEHLSLRVGQKVGRVKVGDNLFQRSYSGPTGRM